LHEQQLVSEQSLGYAEVGFERATKESERPSQGTVQQGDEQLATGQ